MDNAINLTQSHGGLLFPLDMFRPTMLAAALAENLLGKARNIIDARLVLSRHPQSPIVLCRIEGSVVGEDPAAFWKEYVDLALYASQVLPRQVFLYYARGGVDRHEGFLVAQRGQPIAADDSQNDSVDPTSPDKVWPVERLCEQLRVSMDQLSGGFPGGFQVELSLMEPSGDDQAMLMTLAGQGEEQDAEQDPAHDEPADAPPSMDGTYAQASPAGRGAPADARGSRRARRGHGNKLGGRPGAKSPRVTAEDDAKRRAAERAAEAEQLEARANEATSDLLYTVDDHGIVAAPKAELSDTKILGTFLVPEIVDNLPEGLPRSLRDEVGGRAIDFAVRVEFLSEVFVDNKPLSRPVFDERATDGDLAGKSFRLIEVLAPRLGTGTLIRDPETRASVFVSRRLGQPLPAEFLLGLLSDA